MVSQEKKNIVDRITKLRGKMKEKNIDAYLIVSDDFHASEYVCDYFKCREYMSGFTGSAGQMVVMMNQVALWTDGRYFIQAEEQLKGTGIELMKMGEKGVPSIKDYLYEKLNKSQVLGYDGRTIRKQYADILKKVLSSKNIQCIENIDLVGEIWEDRPEFPNADIWLLSEKYAGKSREDKLSQLRMILKEEEADGILLTTLDEIAWLYNMRGADVKYNPVALSYTIVYRNRAVLYRDVNTINPDDIEKLSMNGVEIAPYFNIYDDVQLLKNITLLLDENTINETLFNLINSDVSIVNRTSPIILEKAKKNKVEMLNVRYAHIQDGVAVTKLIYWLKKNRECITELDVCEKLESFRRRGEGYLQQSFEPIVATGAHGAIVHYEPTMKTNVPIEDNTFVLMDTGGQYLYGTTDITRTVGIGKLTRQQKIHYTAVLKGNLNLANARFKYGCSGVNLDYLARRPLWEMGLDFNHGTGHGVGYLLNVHEGPNGIRLRERDGSVGAVLEEGMITSDEPGLYLEGEYGIRLENLLLCVKDRKTEYGQFMKFDTLTMVPFDRDAILPELMSEEEIKMLDEYHAMVYEKISPYCNEEERIWLKEQTKELMPCQAKHL
jgi:Xaa-Pro aminopeptidase